MNGTLCGASMDTVAHEPEPWEPKEGYPTIGARNITACIGNYHCVCGNFNTFELARKTMLNEAKRAQGWADAPLTDEGTKVTKKLACGFKKRGIKFDYTYSSDLGRTRQTAGIILKGLGQPELSLREQQGLREVCFGTYEGEKFSKMMEDVLRNLGC